MKPLKPFLYRGLVFVILASFLAYFGYYYLVACVALVFVLVCLRDVEWIIKHKSGKQWLEHGHMKATRATFVVLLVSICALMVYFDLGSLHPSASNVLWDLLLIAGVVYIGSYLYYTSVEPDLSSKHGFGYNAPRVMAVLITLFFYSFALGEGLHNGWLHFLASLIPGSVILVVTLVAWRSEMVGGGMFIVLSLLYLAAGWNQLTPGALLLIGLPLFVTGSLFILSKLPD
ncbi:hypothetical protein DRJ48_00175 [Candidatus Woesearchaeota archaeon]|nr:MAG: hypothetical protein DRJ48_00175 [Candidatus Woesearchaeota archaeon]